MGIQKREYALGTSMTVSYPWGINVTATVLCPDGRVRKVKRIAQTADTFFSIPASVTVKGKTIAGYVTVGTMAGYSTATDDDPAVIRFIPYVNRANWDAFGACWISAGRALAYAASKA